MPVPPTASPVLKALSARQHKKLATFLAQGADPNQLDHEGKSLLYLACASEQPKAIDALLAAGATPATWTREGRSPLHEAMRHNDAVLVHRLVDAGADPAQMPPAQGLGLLNRKSPLYEGVLHGALDAIKALAERAGDRLDPNLGVESRTERDVPPLFAAINNDHPEIAAWLIERGADLEAPRGILGATPLVQACRRGLDAMLDVLLAAGANPNAADEQGMTSLHHLVRAGHDNPMIVPLAQKLLAAGANLLAVDQRGDTPLQRMERSLDGKESPAYPWWSVEHERAVLRESMDEHPSAPSVRARL